MTAFKELIDSYHSITILSHIHPDADALGTSLGIYALLKAYGKRVEVVNYSEELPQYLDFLPNYTKIKNKMSYEDSLIIACDCGSIDRLGFELDGRDIINIDHHQTNTYYGRLNYVDASLVATSHMAYKLTKEYFTISKEAATCFYVALLSDTQYFKTSNVDSAVFEFAMELLQQEVNHQEVTQHMTLRNSLASIRVLGRALDSLRLHQEAKISSMIVDKAMMESTGATVQDIHGIVDYGKSLVTVEIAIVLVEYQNEIRVSLRSKSKDISILAETFGGGGHQLAAGFTAKSTNLEELLDKILKMISKDKR